MSFAAPERLGLFVAWAVLLLLSLRAARRRRRDWERLARSGRPPLEPTVRLLVALPFALLALARPRWGIDSEAALPPGKDVVIAVDVSRSMAARDAVPDRLGVAVESAVGLISALADRPGDRVGVIAFAGAPVVRCGLTSNLGAAVEALRRLRPGAVRPGGTDLAAALDLALDSFDGYDRAGGRVVVLFTDGEDHPGGWRTSLEKWSVAGVVVHSVTIGDDVRGGRVPIEGGFLEADGRPVETRRDDGPLQAIVDATGGVLVKLGTTSADMAELYRTAVAPREDRVRRETLPAAGRERFSIFLLAALVAAAAPLRVSRGVALLGVLTPLLIGAGRTDDPRTLVEAGRAAFASGNYGEALRRFEEARVLRPLDPVIRYDVGAALARLGRIDEAEASYRAAAERADPVLRLKIDFCLANGLLAKDRAEAAVEAYDRFIAGASTVPELAGLVDDARINRDFAGRRRKPREPAPAPGPTSPRPDPDRNPGPTADPGLGGAETRGTPGGSGGAGGQGRAPVGTGSPEERLRRAVDEIRRTKSGGADEPDPGPNPAKAGKDW